MCTCTWAWWRCPWTREWEWRRVPWWPRTAGPPSYPAGRTPTLWGLKHKLGKVGVSWDLGIGIFCISSILSHLYSFRSCFHIIYRKNWPNFPLWLYDSLISSYILQNRKPNMTTRNSLLSSLASLREEMISVFFVFCPLGLNSQCSKV